MDVPNKFTGNKDADILKIKTPKLRFYYSILYVNIIFYYLVK